MKTIILLMAALFIGVCAYASQTEAHRLSHHPLEILAKMSTQIKQLLLKLCFNGGGR